MNLRLVACVIGLVASIGAVAPALAQVCQKQSPAYTVALLELYTSEGCSSCPPADQFLRDFSHRNTPAGPLNAQVVPLSLHVDYWDYIGWKDRFADPVFTTRQRWLSALAASHTIYTPEIFVGGRALRNWHNDSVAAVRQINARPAAATISLKMLPSSGAGLPIEVKVEAPVGAQLFVALYENGLSSDVRAGENNGVRLQHDYVVREWLGPLALQQDGAALRRTLKLPADARANNLGVAAFVQSPAGEILQALALPSCG